MTDPNEVTLAQREHSVVERLPMLSYSVVAAVILQAVGATWWAATLSERMEHMARQFLKMETQISAIYTGIPTRRDYEDLQKQITDHETRLRDVERRTGMKL